MPKKTKTLPRAESAVTPAPAAPAASPAAPAAPSATHARKRAAAKAPEGAADSTLESTPPRAQAFLRAAGISPVIFAVLASAGYSEAVHHEGWGLLMAASGYHPAKSAKPAPTSRASAALAELNSWDEPNFRLARAALKSRHAAQYEFVMEGVEASADEAAAAVAIEVFLSRLDALEGSPKRKSTRAADHAALATLTSRGITPAERKRVKALLVDAKAPPPKLVAGAPELARIGTESYWSSLRALRDWYEEWAEVARVKVKRRDQLITLGLAQRRASKSAS